METKKQLGQHWLTDNQSLNSIVQVANITGDDMVLEIGPGLGTLTKKLVAKAKQVFAVEVDQDLFENLKKNQELTNVKLYNLDILKFNLNDLPASYKVVANIPYYLTSVLIKMLNTADNPPKSMCLLVQKEVAERITATPGSLSVLAISVQLYNRVSLGPIIKAEKFLPPPKVDSQIVLLDRLAKPLFDVDDKKFMRVVKAGFANKRKTLPNSLAASFNKDKSVIKKLVEESNLPLNIRAQELSLADWYRLYQLGSGAKD